MAELLVYYGDTEPPPWYARQVRSLLQTEGFLEPPSGDARAGIPLIAPELHPVYLLLVEGRTVQSYARTIWARIEYSGHSYKLYGLGDVVTRAGTRKIGCGSRVVEAATAHIRADSEADAAVLLGEPALEAFYARHGWEHVPELLVSTSEGNSGHEVSGFPMALFVSARARAASAIFHTIPRILPGDEW